MPEDELVAIRQAMLSKETTGRFISKYNLKVRNCCYAVYNLVCPRGHRYFIGNVSV